MVTSPIGLRAWASTGSAGARTPSSLLIKIRYGRGDCAAVTASRYTAIHAVQNAVSLDGLGRRLRNIVEDEAVLHFLHRNALGLVRMLSMDLRFARLVETRQRAASKLLRAHGGDIHEQKPAFDGSGFRARRRRCFRFSGCFDEWLVGVHQYQSLARKARRGRTERPALRLRGDVDADRPRLRFLAERQLHGEDAVLVVSTYLRCVDR